MERKTLKKLTIGLLCLTSGIGLFAVGVVCSAPIAGLVGTVLLINGAIDTVSSTVKGVQEKISFNKFWKQRQAEIDARKEKFAQQNLVVSEFKSEKQNQSAQNLVFERTSDQIPTISQESESTL